MTTPGGFDFFNFSNGASLFSILNSAYSHWGWTVEALMHCLLHSCSCVQTHSQPIRLRLSSVTAAYALCALNVNKEFLFFT